MGPALCSRNELSCRSEIRLNAVSASEVEAAAASSGCGEVDAEAVCDLEAVAAVQVKAARTCSGVRDLEAAACERQVSICCRM